MSKKPSHGDQAIPIYSQIWEAFQARKAADGLTVVELHRLAEKQGCTICLTAFHKVLRGERRLETSLAEALALALGITIVYPGAAPLYSEGG